MMASTGPRLFRSSTILPSASWSARLISTTRSQIRRERAQTSPSSLVSAPSAAGPGLQLSVLPTQFCRAFRVLNPVSYPPQCRRASTRITTSSSRSCRLSTRPSTPSSVRPQSHTSSGPHLISVSCIGWPGQPIRDLFRRCFWPCLLLSTAIHPGIHSKAGSLLPSYSLRGAWEQRALLSP